MTAQTTLTPQDDALIIIDMQKAFRDDGSPWQVTGYNEAAHHVASLVERYSERTIWTRFVRDPNEDGSWEDYYDRWSDFRIAEDDPTWDITLPVADGDAIVTRPTFGKWGDDLSRLTAGVQNLIICGVATECCVLATVLAAIDAGKSITLVTDACAGATKDLHRQTLDIFNALHPMVSLTTTAQLTGASENVPVM